MAFKNRRLKQRELLVKRSWDTVWGPAKAMGMQLFMLWMMGSGGINKIHSKRVGKINKYTFAS